MAGWRFYLNNIEVEEPIGWDTIEFTANRTDNYGIDQPFSGSVTFYSKGAQILKNAWDLLFVSADVAFKIISNDLVNGLPYEYNGVIDFSTYEEINSCDSDSWQVSVAILQDSFRDKFKARYDVEIDLFAEKDLDGKTIPSGYNDTDVIRLHGQSLALTAIGGSLANSQHQLEKDTNIVWIRSDASSVVPVYWNNSDFGGIFGQTFDVTGLNFTGTNVIFQDNSNSGLTREFVLSWEQFRVDFNFFLFNWATGTPPAPATMNISLFYLVVTSGGTLVSETELDASQVITLGSGIQTWNVPAGSAPITIPPDCRLFFYIKWGTLGNVQYGLDPYNVMARCDTYFFDDIRVKLTETNDAKASICNALTVEKFLRRIIYQLTGSNNRLISDVFNESAGGDFANNVIVNGLLLRRYIPEGTDKIQMRTSFKSAFESLSAIFGLGWAFEKQADGSYCIRVEPYEYFYQNIIELELTNVEQLKQSSSTDAFYSQLKLGFSDNWKNMSLGGIDAVCTDRNYFINNKAIKYGSTSTLELKSDIICEGIAIEYSRRLQFFDDNSGSSDRPNDYSLFLIWTIRQSFLITDEEEYPYYYFPDETGSLTLLPYRTSWASSLMNYNMPRWGDELYRYNLYHTSARVALRHWAILGGNTYGMVNPVWRFQVGQYNTRFDSAIATAFQPKVIENTSDSGGSPLLAEDTDIDVSIIRNQFQEYITKPIIFECDYPQAFCDFIHLANYAPYRKVRVSIGSVTVSGFIMNIKNKPEDNSGGTTTFTLIASNIPDPSEEGPYNESWNNAYL